MEEKEETSLGERLRERIELEGGAISFHDWMEAALYDEQDGYYRRASLRRWGREGDYRTSPERSPLFAAAFARFFATLYEELDRPARWTVWEAGAGAGFFAQGLLETFARSFPQILSATRYVLDEKSEASSALALERLKPFGARVEQRSLHETLATFDTGVIFANELLDAFPVHRVTLREGRLLELYVGVDDEGEFRWIEGEASMPLLSEHLERLSVRLAEGQVAEINLDAGRWLKRAADAFERGYVVLVDYGAEANHLYDAGLRPQGSLRAFRGHQLVSDVLQSPGEQDITATVDWTTVKSACEEVGLKVLSFERQEEFLLRAGLLEELSRMEALTSSESASLELRVSAREMILPGSMSAHFQVLVAGK